MPDRRETARRPPPQPPAEVKVLGHHAYAATSATLAGILAGEDQVIIAVGVFAIAVACFHLGRAIPRGAGRIEAMAWFLPIAAVGAVLFL